MRSDEGRLGIGDWSLVVGDWALGHLGAEGRDRDRPSTVHSLPSMSVVHRPWSAVVPGITRRDTRG